MRWAHSGLTFGGLARLEWPILLLVLVLAGAVWGFAELADEVVEGDTHAVDRMILLVLRSDADLADPLGPEWLEEMMRDYTALGVLTLFTGKKRVTLAVVLTLRRPDRPGAPQSASEGLCPVRRGARNRSGGDQPGVSWRALADGRSGRLGHGRGLGALVLAWDALVPETREGRKRGLALPHIGRGVTGNPIRPGSTPNVRRIGYPIDLYRRVAHITPLGARAAGRLCG